MPCRPPAQLIQTVTDRDDDEAAQQTLAYRTTQIRKRQAAAYSGQVAQAERVMKRTRVELKAGVAGDNVAVPIPLVDRGRRGSSVLRFFGMYPAMGVALYRRGAMDNLAR